MPPYARSALLPSGDSLARRHRVRHTTPPRRSGDGFRRGGERRWRSARRRATRARVTRRAVSTPMPFEIAAFALRRRHNLAPPVGRSGVFLARPWIHDICVIVVTHQGNDFFVQRIYRSFVISRFIRTKRHVGLDIQYVRISLLVYFQRRPLRLDQRISHSTSPFVSPSLHGAGGDGEQSPKTSNLNLIVRNGAPQRTPWRPAEIASARVEFR